MQLQHRLLECLEDILPNPIQSIIVNYIVDRDVSHIIAIFPESTSIDILKRLRFTRKECMDNKFVFSYICENSHLKTAKWYL